MDPAHLAGAAGVEVVNMYVGTTGRCGVVEVEHLAAARALGAVALTSLDLGRYAVTVEPYAGRAGLVYRVVIEQRPPAVADTTPHRPLVVVSP